jgi:hypothetical protein
VKLKYSGEIEWIKTYGGSRHDVVESIKSLEDGGYALTGQTDSKDGDFKNMVKDEEDVFIMKLDTDGDLESVKTNGGFDQDHSYDIAVDLNGNFVISGHTQSNDGDFFGLNDGAGTGFIYKFNPNND